MDVSDVDRFLAEDKVLQGGLPEWRESSRAGENEATWIVEDSLGIASGQLRFRLPLSHRSFPSVSVIFRGNPIWRVDLVAADRRKFNPPDAHLYGLPAEVRGSHGHEWPDNRDFVAAEEIWHLPYRRPIQVQIRRLSQLVPWLAERIRLRLDPDQRGFDIPPQAELFGG